MKLVNSLNLNMEEQYNKNLKKLIKANKENEELKQKIKLRIK